MDIFVAILTAIIIIIGIPFHFIRVGKEKNNDRPISPSNREATDNSDDKGSRYDVFLSFRGPDIRNRFAGHLYKALKDRSINVFMDRHNLGKGEPIEKLLEIIEESRILMPIFSKGYSQSVWCMREITKMVEMRAMGKVRIIPVFFDVEPLEVRNWSALNWDKGGASVAEKENWKKALQTAARIHGFNLTNHANGDEPKLVELIVKDVEAKLMKTPLHIAKYPIGVECRVQEVMNLLKSEGRDVKMIGLQGMPGIGKTTIAGAVYNKLFHDFDGASTFISDVGETFRRKGGVKCQKQLIHDIMPSKDHSGSYICSIDAGKSKIIENLKCRKVLIVLDDIDHIEQLQALAGGRDWFGPGSVIIITSKHEDVLLKHYMEDCQIYKPKLLDDEESFQLFVSHVFEDGQPTTEEELDMSRRIAKTAGGLPIALTVLGPHFFACGGNMRKWRDELGKLKDIPHEDIQKKLRISYDGLGKEGKEIFLDIACFFIGADCEGAPRYYWEACDFYPGSAITLLQQRSLISLDMENRFHMHDLLRNMGREIVLQRGKEIPSSARTRLWSSDDIFTLLQRNDVPSCEVLKAIMLEQGVEEGKELRNSVECFRNMHHLKLLHMEGVNFKNNFHHFPSELMWLGLPRCFFASPLVLGTNLQNLVILNLSNCDLASSSFSGDVVFEKLKVLDLSSTDLTTTPDFRNFPSLKELTLLRCEKLIKVDPSIGSLKSLVMLDMRTCTMLEKLPDTMCDLWSIEVLHLGWCENLSSLPEHIGDLTSLKELSLNNTGIRKIPDSVGQLTSLCELSLQHCQRLEPLPDSVSGWFSSGKLKMFGAPLKIIDGIDISVKQQVLEVSSCKVLAFLPDESCKVVKEFYLTDPGVQEFPYNIRRLQNLIVLSLKCEQLRALPPWINGKHLEKLRDLEIESKSLKTLPESIGSLEGLKILKLVCENLESMHDSTEKLKNLEIFEVVSRNLQRLPRWIGSLRSLRQLKVKCSRINRIPESIKQLEGLEIFELHMDNPKALPDSTTLPKKLKKFTLSCKNIDNLPDCVWSLGEIETLSLRGCGRIQALPDEKLMQLKSLIHLDLSQTGVKEIHENICCLPKLRSLQINDVGNGTSFWFE